MEMDLLQVSLLSLFLLVVTLSLRLLFRKSKNGLSGPLPPGRTGWLLVGESIEFVLAGWKGQPETFILERMAKYSSTVFRTHILGHPFTVFCGLSGNKFLFSNESKLVKAWWPSALNKVLSPSQKTHEKKDSIMLRKLLPKMEGLQRYIAIMDQICQKHFESGWENKDQVKAFPLCGRLSFFIACKLFVSVEDPTQVDKLYEQFSVMTKGLFSIPIDLPGIAFNRAIKASKCLRKMIKVIIKQRKIDLAQGKALQIQDILSYLLLITDENGKFVDEFNAINKIIGLLVAGHGTTTSVCTSIVRFLADLPEIYEGVYNEQMEIARSKAPDEFLNWDDIQKMSYSWNVVCEVLRLAPPTQGAFKEALTDFTFNGFSILKGSKIHWNLNTTHKNPEYFPKPEKFDPSRFEGSGPAPYTYVPFGGGPRMCPGKEFARFEILVFIHNLVKRFKWEKIIPDEKFFGTPAPNPVHGLPIKLYPHTA